MIVYPGPTSGETRVGSGLRAQPGRRSVSGHAGWLEGWAGRKLSPPCAWLRALACLAVPGAYLAIAAGCATSTPTASSTPTLAPSPRPTATATATPTLAPSPRPTATATATPTPSLTPTTTRTPTPDPVLTHPLSVHRMRSVAYPGSEIRIDRELDPLDPGSNYGRYLASYLSEGYRINALWTLPEGEPPPDGWPAIIFNHGYIPPDQYATAARYVRYVDAFARRGYAVLMSDYRGHGRSEGRAEGGYGSPAYTVDVLNALSSVRAHSAIDPERVGMWGHSMGGHITLRSMVVTDSIKAGVIWAGVAVSYEDLFTRWRRPYPTPTAMPAGIPSPTPRWPWRWRRNLFDTYGDPAFGHQVWDAISPIRFVEEISGPLQIHHGTRDADVPFEFSEILRDDLIAAGHQPEFFTYEGDDHNLSGSLALALERSVAFFDQHLR